MSVKNELTVLEQLRDVVDEILNPGSQTVPVLVDFPSVDKMPASQVVFMLPDYAEYESLATVNDRAEFRITMWILCKRAPKADLATAVYGLYNTVYEELRQNTDLNGFVDFCEVRSADFYPSVEMNESVQGIEATLAVQYTKDWL